MRISDWSSDVCSSDLPERYLIRSETSIPRFLEDGLYFRHLSRFVDFFPREQISIILYDDIKSRPDEVIGQVCDHIGAPRTPSLKVGGPVKFKEADRKSTRLNSSH